METAPTQNQNPLDQDLGSVDTSFPLVARGVMDLKCVKSEVAMNKKQTGEVWKVELQTIDEAKTPTGDPVRPGKTIFHSVGLSETPNYKALDIARNAGAVIQGFGLSGVTVRTIKTWAGQLVGLVARCNVDIEPAGRTADGKSFPAKNVVASFLQRGQ